MAVWERSVPGYSCKRDEDDARARLRAFWAGSSLGRPALHVTVVDPAYRPTPFAGDPARSVANDFTPAWHAWQADNLLLRTTFLAEAMPGVVLNWGGLLTTVGVLAGAEYVYQDSSAWFRPLPDLWSRPLPAFDPSSDIVRTWEACFDRVVEVVGRRGFINAPIMLDGLTTLSTFRTPRQLCIDCLEAPEQVRAWSDTLTTLYLACYDHFYRRLVRQGYGESVTWLGAMAEGTLEAVQCDFAVMLSPHHFERLVLPDLARLTEYFDYSLYHLDGTCQLRFLDQLATLPRLNGIQWNPEPPANPPTRWIDAFRDLRRRGWVLHIDCATVAEAAQIAREVGPDGLLLKLPPFADEATARAAIQTITQAC